VKENGEVIGSNGVAANEEKPGSPVKSHKSSPKKEVPVTETE